MLTLHFSEHRPLFKAGENSNQHQIWSSNKDYPGRQEIQPKTVHMALSKCD
jgi:hypothetical protein